MGKYVHAKAALASDALVKISTLSCEEEYEGIKKLVQIMFMRNHSKSIAPGVRAGEKSVPLKLLCALHEEDQNIATALLKNLVLYGSWASLTRRQ